MKTVPYSSVSRACGLMLIGLWLGVGAVHGRQNPAPAQTPAPTPTPAPTQTPTPPTPSNPGAPGQTAPPRQSTLPQATQPVQPGPMITREDAVRLALAQASAYQQAALNERIAAEDVKQARSAFLPKFDAPLSYIYNTPIIGTTAPPDTSSAPSFIASNAVREYLAGAGMTGDIDIAGKLRATLRRNQALLQAAHAGTDAARLALVEATEEAYYGVSLAVARRRSAELNLSAAEEFEHITSLLFSGGEVASIDVTRARLQTEGRRDELEQARNGEIAAIEGLRALIGYSAVTQQFSVVDLMDVLPRPDEIQVFTADAIARRPELRQFEFEREAANQEIRIAHADRLPQLSYLFNAGFDTDSLFSNLRQHTGALAQFSLTIPIFDWGIAKSRENQGRFRMRIAESEREQTLRTFIQQFNTARALAQTAAIRVDRVRLSVVDAQKNVETSEQRYRSGEAQIIEVTDALSTLAQQRSALSQAIFDYQVALSRLRQATGR
ncbi:MAG TPA: TolC family protein [Blastocatellia bacterium]|nr:TolC family protein [Blastocatellia bacterium]